MSLVLIFGGFNSVGLQAVGFRAESAETDKPTAGVKMTSSDS